MDTNEEPLIWTTRGNVPLASLEYCIGWEITDTSIVFREQYRFKDTGEVAKENSHIKLLEGSDVEGETAVL